MHLSALFAAGTMTFGLAVTAIPLSYYLYRTRKQVESYAPLVKQCAEYLQNHTPQLVSSVVGQPFEFQIFDYEQCTSTDGKLVKLAFPIYARDHDGLVCCWAEHRGEQHLRYQYGNSTNPWGVTKFKYPHLTRFDNSQWLIQRLELWREGDSNDMHVAFPAVNT